MLMHMGKCRDKIWNKKRAQARTLTQSARGGKKESAFCIVIILINIKCYSTEQTIQFFSMFDDEVHTLLPLYASEERLAPLILCGIDS